MSNTPITEAKHPFCFVVSEDSDGAGFLSRDVATIAGGEAGATIRVGDVLAKSADGTRVPLNPAADNGTQHFDSIAAYPVHVPAGETAQITVINTHATVRDADLNYPTGITAPQKATLVAEMADKLIKLR